MSKKSFNDNPAMAFITESTKDTHNTDYTHNTQGTETKSKRLNLLLTPSLHADLTKISKVQMTSVNNLINEILEEYVKDNQHSLEKYKKIWG
jgi:predicted HicB family RNase H-like nuclease